MAIREEVSGIGPMSKRVDLNVSKQPARYISGLPYGQGQETYNRQGEAPMYVNPLAEVQSDVIPITAFTQRKDEPVTAGIDFPSAGPGSEAMAPMPARPTVSLVDTFKTLSMFDPSGDSELVYRRLVDEGY
ncbi:hypothetical protein EB001_08905 [bacterium]|nr:hypothetical protein [bacterium]